MPLWLQELGGNALWFDRFLAQHIAIFYYFMTALMYAISPRMACKYYVLNLCFVMIPATSFNLLIGLS
jgi:hypothetical protein